MPIRGLYTLSLLYPASTTYMMPSTVQVRQILVSGPYLTASATRREAEPNEPVNEVSAILVVTMTFRRPSSVGEKILACKSAGICE